MSTQFEQSIRQTLIAMTEVQLEDVRKRHDAALEMANTVGLAVHWSYQKHYSAMLYRLEQLHGKLTHDWREDGIRKGIPELPDKPAFLEEEDEALLPGTRVIINEQLPAYSGQTAVFQRMRGHHYGCITGLGQRIFLPRSYFDVEQTAPTETVAPTRIMIEDHIGKPITITINYGLIRVGAYILREVDIANGRLILRVQDLE